MVAGASVAWGETAAAFVAAHIEMVLPVAFALGFAESIVVVSLFVPSTVLLLGLGGLHMGAGGVFWTLWIATAVGAFIGDLVTFAFARAFKKNAREAWPLRNYPRSYARARLHIRQWGLAGIVASKFFGFVRPFVPAVAGAMGMRWPLFVAASAISALLWAGAVLAPGYGAFSLLG